VLIRSKVRWLVKLGRRLGRPRAHPLQAAGQLRDVHRLALQEHRGRPGRGTSAGQGAPHAPAAAPSAATSVDASCARGRARRVARPRTAGAHMHTWRTPKASNEKCQALLQPAGPCKYPGAAKE